MALRFISRYIHDCQVQKVTLGRVLSSLISQWAAARPLASGLLLRRCRTCEPALSVLQQHLPLHQRRPIRTALRSMEFNMPAIAASAGARPTDKASLRDRAAGAVLGSLIGDALGVGEPEPHMHAVVWVGWG